MPSSWLRRKSLQFFLLTIAIISGAFFLVLNVYFGSHFSHEFQNLQGMVTEFLSEKATHFNPTCKLLKAPTILVESTTSLLLLWETTYCGNVFCQLCWSTMSGTVSPNVGAGNDSREMCTLNGTRVEVRQGRVAYRYVITSLRVGQTYHFTVIVKTKDTSTTILRGQRQQTDGHVLLHSAGSFSWLADPGASSNGDRVTLAVIGDSQSGARVFRHHLSHLAPRSPAVLLHLGDVVQDPTDMEEWNRCAYFFLTLFPHTVSFYALLCNGPQVFLQPLEQLGARHTSYAGAREPRHR
jgi:hypothetical protein